MSGPSVRAVVTVLLLAVASDAAAERLPVKSYTVDNGLAHNRVKRIVQDSRGFLWFCTADGLSRFDGSQFINYQIEDGLLAPSINDLAEGGDGIYWIATNSDGVFRFDTHAGVAASGAQRFTRYPVGAGPVTNRVNVLYRDPGGVLWAGTDGGLFALGDAGGQRVFAPVALHIASYADIEVQVWALATDSAGSLWIGTKYGLVRRLRDGAMQHVAIEPLPADDNVSALLVASDGRLWVGHRAGLLAFTPALGPGLPAGVRRYTTKDGLDNNTVLDVHQSADGRIWIRTFGAGLTVFDGVAFRTYVTAPQVSEAVGSMTEDREGNLWLGTNALGALKITKHGWTRYGEPEGLGASVSSMFETRDGEVYASSSPWLISRLDGPRFATVRPGLPKTVTDESWRDVNNVLQDRTGDWWIATRAGLYRFGRTRRFEDLSSATPKQVYTTRDGLAHDDVTRVFEDSHGNIWIASWVPAREAVVRWDRATGRFHRYSDKDGLRPFTSVITFVEDLAGNVWLGLREGGLARYRNGRFTMLGADDGLPAGGVNGIYRDTSGRIWAAVNRGGLVRIDEPGIDRPRVVAYTTAAGLASDVAVAVTGDAAGRVYVGTSRGVDRLDPKTGRVKHYSTGDGLTGGEFKAALRDRRGALWFCTTMGVSRLVPEPDEVAMPSPVWIGAMRIAGVARPLSALGERTVSGVQLNPDENNVQIEFFGIGFQTREALRFQYKLEGTGEDWSAPSAQHTVNYANLAPGAYRFLVRAVGTDGSESPAPASVSFAILPPVWRRWWFLALAASIAASAALVWARARHERMQALRESENRFRTLAETASDAIITIDEQSRIVLVNEAAETVFGYTRREMVGADLTMLMPTPLRHQHRAGFARYLETGRRSTPRQAVELPGLRKDGREVPLEISFGEFTRNGRRYVTGIARDITERRRAEDQLRRIREERLEELERVRKRIATDLHDDIGSTLTRISLLGEVARQQAGSTDRSVVEPLSSIASLSRELVDSMSDIVWAINPKKDHLSDLSQRMRHFASDLFTARQVDFRFRTPDTDGDVAVGANVRRELFLVFKEAVNNVVRHSACTEAALEFRAEPDGLVLVVSDNGRGFDVRRASDGHGLLSMRQRTEALGGRFEVISTPGEGTLLSFTIPFADHIHAPHEYAVTNSPHRA
jgi:PAS domain S-box-containing protein